MRISLHKKMEGRAGVLTVYIDDEPWRDIHTSIFGKKPNIPTDCTTLNEWEERFQQLEYRGALQYALKRLSVKNQPSTELKAQMEKHLVSEGIIKRIISECKSLGYINDEDWLKSFVKHQISRNQGPHSIVMKLRAKGISQNAAEELVRTLNGNETQQEQIKQLLSKRYRNRDLTDRGTRDKVIAALMRRGFSFDQIRTAMHK